MKNPLPALEKNILKYRALQMVLLLNQVEALRSFLIGSIRGTDRVRALTSKAPERLSQGTKNPLKNALAILIEEQIISASDRDDIEKIVNIRNDVGHAMHRLLEDITVRPRHLDDALAHANSRYAYDYHALARLERYQKQIKVGMSGKFILQLNLSGVHYEHAEATYKEELARLAKRIQRQFQPRRKAVQEALAKAQALTKGNTRVPGA